MIVAMDFHAKYISAPNNWELFEHLCLGIFREVWSDPLAEMHGRRGQAQHGVDIYSSPQASLGGRYGIQCKGKDHGYGHAVTIAELDAEIAKAETFTPPLVHWILATTAHRDSTLQAEVRRISDRRQRSGLFTVQVLAWQDLQILMADHSTVIEKFYPEHAFNLSKLISSIRSLPDAVEAAILKARLVSTEEAPVLMGNWSQITFEAVRDLGPALLGQGMGPADAAACPRLLETDQILGRMEIGYSARLVGEPGAGKSATAYQVAHQLVAKGWQIWRLEDPRASVVPLPPEAKSRPTLVLLDDAHLMPPAVLRRFEEMATERFQVLSTFNVADRSVQPAGSIYLDSKRAVETIAGALRKRRAETLAAVRRADDRVGDGAMQEDLDQRLRAAENEADRPWQFCFILGGGWRRAKEFAASARGANADLVLASIAMRQVGSRDARPSLRDLRLLCDAGGISEDELKRSLQWLVGNRLLISEADLRCPHQQFALKVLEQIIEGQNDAGRQQILAVSRAVILDGELSLGGISLLLSHLLRIDRIRWGQLKLLTDAALQALKARAWAAAQPDEISFAADVIAALEPVEQNWPRAALEPHLDQLSRWLSDLAFPSAHGLARLINNVWNTDKDFAKELIATCVPEGLAAAISAAEPEATFALAHLLDRLNLGTDETWRAKFDTALNRPALLLAARGWPSDRIWALSELVTALDFIDHGFALDLLEAASAQLAARFAEDPLAAFSELDDVLWRVLHVWMPLGPASKLASPKSREVTIARAAVGAAKAAILADKLSKTQRRKLGIMSRFLSVVRRASPKRFREITNSLRWEDIEVTIGDGWANLDHDEVVLLCVASANKRALEHIRTMLLRRSHDLKVVDTRIVLLCPEAAIAAFELGAKVDLGRSMTFSWILAAVALHEVAQRNSNAAREIARSSLQEMVQAFERNQANTYEHVDVYLQALRDYAPGVLEDGLDALNPEKAEAAWATCLRSPGKPRQAAVALISSAVSRPGEIANVANRLRKQFPRTLSYLPTGLESVAP